MDTWTEFFRTFFQRFSPKVVLPFLFVQATNAVLAIGHGGWDSENSLLAAIAFVAATLGFSAPPAPDVKHDEVKALSKRRDGR